MPYLQVGVMRGTESSWFMRNGIAWATAGDSSKRALLWLPTVGWYRHRGSGTDRGLFLTAVIGNQPFIDRECYLHDCFAHTRTVLIVGLMTSLVLEGPTPRRR